MLRTNLQHSLEQLVYIRNPWRTRALLHQQLTERGNPLKQFLFFATGQEKFQEVTQPYHVLLIITIIRDVLDTVAVELLVLDIFDFF